MPMTKLPGIGEERDPQEVGRDEVGRDRRYSTESDAGERLGMPWDVPQAQQRLNIDDIVVNRMIGQGKFSEVFEGSLYGDLVAVKTVHGKACLREVNLLRKIKHNNFIRMLHALAQDSALHIVMELCEGGSLFHLLHDPKIEMKRIVLSWAQRVRMLMDVASAMEYMHGMKPQILHRDLKSLNLLLAKPIRSTEDLPLIKVADLGLSRTLRQHQDEDGSGDKSISRSSNHSFDRMTTDVGTLQWMAPEIHVRDDYTEKVDVYSFAMVAYEIAWQRIPFCDQYNRSNTFVLERVLLGLRPDITVTPEGCPEELPALIKVCWVVNPVSRPRFTKIYPWLKAVATEKGYDRWTMAL